MMSIIYFALLILGTLGFLLTIWLAVHFMERCGKLGIPFSRSIRDVNELVRNPTSPKEIRQDAKKWLLLPDLYAAIALLVWIFGDWNLVIDQKHINVVPAVFTVYALLSIFTLIVLLPARHFKDKLHPLE
jgi:hypothetical protein